MSLPIEHQPTQFETEAQLSSLIPLLDPERRAAGAPAARQKRVKSTPLASIQDIDPGISI